MTHRQRSSASTHTEAVLGKTRSTRSRAAQRISVAAIGAALVGLTLVGPASARPDDGVETTQQHRTSVSSPGGQQSKSEPLTQIVKIDDNALEQLQIGLGALCGLALAGAAAGAVTARRRHQHAV